MKILFCDLCNESVPQSELDAGRAFMRKGRVVCGKCDQLMTQREEAPAAAISPIQPAPAPAPFGQSTLTPLAGPVAAADAGHGAPHHHHHAHSPYARSPSGGGGGGIAVGLFAIVIAVFGFVWFFESSKDLGEKLDARLEKLEREQQGADTRAMERSTELRGELLALQEKLGTQASEERRAVEVRLEEANRKYGEAQTAVVELKAAIDDLKTVLPSLQRHDQELAAGSQRLAQLDTRAASLESALSDMKKQLEQKAAAPPPPVAVAPPAGGTPPWMGLVAQLESPQSGDRWVAVTSLGETRDPAVAEYLLPRLKDVDIFVRMATARVLGDLGSPKAIGALIDALGDHDASVREAVYVALCTVSKKNLPFDAYQDPGERAKKVKAWQDWWKKAQEEGAAQ